MIHLKRCMESENMAKLFTWYSHIFYAIFIASHATFHYLALYTVNERRTVEIN